MRLLIDGFGYTFLMVPTGVGFGIWRFPQMAVPLVIIHFSMMTLWELGDAFETLKTQEIDG